MEYEIALITQENSYRNEQPRKEFKLIRYLYYLQRGMVRLLLTPGSYLPEGGLKTAIRRFVLRFQHSLPTEFVVNWGDTVIQVGTPWPRTMRRFRKAVGCHGRMFIIEAEPRNQQRLEEAIANEGYDNVYLVKAAAWSETRPGKLTICAYFGDHKI